MVYNNEDQGNTRCDYDADQNQEEREEQQQSKSNRVSERSKISKNKQKTNGNQFSSSYSRKQNFGDIPGVAKNIQVIYTKLRRTNKKKSKQHNYKKIIKQFRQMHLEDKKQSKKKQDDIESKFCGLSLHDQFTKN